MTESERLFERAKKRVPGGVNSPVRAFSPYPFFTKYAKGSRIVDVDGNEYLDYCLGYGPMILGHAPEQVISAVKEQLDNGTVYGTPSRQEVDFAELVCKLVPSAEMIRLTSTGGEATMSAIRAARGYTGRKKIIKFEGCYHGAHDSVLVKAGSGATTFGVPTSLGVPEEASDNTLVVPYNDTERFESVVKENKNSLAAVIVEPVLGNVGLILPKEGFLETLRELTEKYGIVLIFDEVITGFRLCLGGAQEYYDVKPDMTTLGKILGGGLPLAAFCGKEEIMKMIAPAGKVYQAGTYNGNPVSVTAGLRTLNFLLEKGASFYSEMEGKCERIVESLKKMLDELGLGFQVNHISSMFQMFFTDQPVCDYASAMKADNGRFMEFHKKLMGQGIFLPPSQYETCFLSLAHTSGDLDKTVKSFREALSQL